MSLTLEVGCVGLSQASRGIKMLILLSMMSVMALIAVSFALALTLTKFFPADETSDRPWMEMVTSSIIYLPIALCWIVGTNTGASAFSSMAFFPAIIMELFWFPVTVTEGIEAFMLRGYDLNGWDRK